jgi:hypothetical protein
MRTTGEALDAPHTPQVDRLSRLSASAGAMATHLARRPLVAPYCFFYS